MSKRKHTTADRGKARPTIGFLTGNVWSRVSPYPTMIWTGVADAARERDANLICFAAWSLGILPLDEFEAQRNVLYDLVTSDSVDGLVISSGMLGMFVSVEEFQDFCDRYCPLPMVSIALALEGIPSVLVDNATGLRDAVSHLIEVHGYRRIAFIRGPEGHEEADVRYRAYAEALAEHGFALNPDLVASGDFLSSSGAAAMRLLLDERKLRPGLDFEAVMAASDAMALGALEVLQAQGAQVPYDVAMVGFDDVAEARVSTPSLTTVRQPIHEQGKQAVEMLLALLTGEDVPERVTLPTEMVVRQSCGCHSQAVLQAAAEPVVKTKASRGRSAGKTLEKALATRRDEIVGAMVQAVADYAGEAAPATTAEWAGQVLDGFEAAMGDGSPEGFLSTLDQVLRHVATASGDLTGSAQSVSAWQGALSALRSLVLPWLADDKVLPRAENIWQQARLFITEAAQQVQRYQELQAEQQTGLLQAAGQAMITTFEVEDLMDVLARELPRLGIPSAYLSLYEGQGMPPQECRLILAYDEADGAYPGGRVELAAGGQRFASCRLVPEGLLPQDRCYQLIVEPLYFRERQIGFVLFELEKATQQTGLISETLRGQLSSALQAALLTQQVRHRALQLQTAAEVSSAASGVLDPDRLIQQVVDLARERFDLYYAGLFLVDQTGEWTGEPGKWAVLRAGTGKAGQKMLEQGHRLEVGGESMIGWCVASKQARIALDVTSASSVEPGAEVARFENPLLPETRSELALPLVSRGQAIGALTIQSTQEAAFSQEDVAVLQTMAGQLANVIVNARLYEQTQAHANELAVLNELSQTLTTHRTVQGVLEEVHRGASRLLDVTNFYMALYDSDKGVITFPFDVTNEEEDKFSTPLADQGLTGYVIRHRESVLIEENLPERLAEMGVEMVGKPALSWLGAPMILGDRVLGMLGVQSYSVPRAYDEHDRDLLAAFASQAAIAIENARLFEQTQIALEEAEVTQRRYQIHAWSEYARTRETSGYRQSGVEVEPLGGDVLPEVRQALAEGHTVVQEDDGSSVLTVPLMLRGQPLGALGFRAKDEKREWTADDIALAETIAEQFALAAEGLRLLDETQRRAVRERLTGEITSHVRETLDLERVLRTATDEIYRALGLKRVVVRLKPAEDAVDREGPTAGNGELAAPQEEAA